MIGAQVGPYLPKGGWQLSASGSQFATGDEYTGSNLDQNLTAEGKDVIEGSTATDFDVSYGITKQLSVTADVPVTLNYHWSAVIAGKRWEDTARGLNDITFSARYWLFDCTKHTDQDIAVNLGLRTPTGNANSLWPFPLGNGTDVIPRPVFTGAQMGSGAYGVVLAVDGFKEFRYFTIFGTGSYLISTKAQNNTLSLGAALSPAGPGSVPANVRYNSTPDSYLVHTGAAIPLHIPRLSGLSGLFAGRMVGVPVTNLFGPTLGFRQPGYFVTVEPGLNFDTKLATYSISVPLRAYANVEPAVAGTQTGISRNSDFTHNLILMSVSFTFGGHKTPEVEEAPAPIPSN